GRGSGAVIACVSLDTGAGDGSNGSGCLHNFADYVVGSVGNEEIAGSVDGNARRNVQRGVHCGTAIAGVGPSACTCDGRNSLSRVHFADTIVQAVRDVHISGFVQGYTGGQVQARTQGGPVLHHLELTASRRIDNLAGRQNG